MFLPLMHTTNGLNRVLVFLLGLLFLLLCTGCAAGVGSRAPAALSAHPSVSCSQAGLPSVVLFVRQVHAPDAQRCLREKSRAPQGTAPQLLTPPLTGVERVCAFQADASVTYASDEDPPARAPQADGSIDLFIRAGTCQSVAQAVALDSMTVTDVWIAPWYGGIRSDALPPSLLHQVDAPTCAHRSDFFTIWSDGRQQKQCYANAGQLALVVPLSGVTRVCSGNNAGEALFHATQISGLVVSLEPDVCVTMASLLQEPSITIDTVLIAPPLTN